MDKIYQGIKKIMSPQVLQIAIMITFSIASSCFGSNDAGGDTTGLASWQTGGITLLLKSSGMIWFFRVLGILMVVFAFIVGAGKWMFAGERGGDEKNKLIIVAVAGFIIILAPTIVSLILKAMGVADVTASPS